MAENKIISYDVELLSTNKRRAFYVPEIYTNDLYTNEFQFNIIDMTAAELTGATASILLDMKDGSFFNNDDVTRSGNVFKYILKENEGNHFGIAEVQLVVKISGKDYATPLYKLAVMQGLDDRKANEVVINDLNSETRREIAKLKSETAASINNLSTQWQQVIDETTGKDVISAPEIIAARNGESSLSARLLRDYEAIISSLSKKKNTNNHYVPTTEIKAVNDTGDINAKTVKYSDIIALFDNLLSQSSIIKKRLLKRDSSNTYDIFAYDIILNESNNYIVADGNMHGDGSNGDPKDVAIALYYLVKDIVENHESNDKLAYILSKANLSIIPVANPWGYDNDSRLTSNGVDINRNFNYNHTPSAVGGATPHSENETQAIIQNVKTIRKRLKNTDYKIIAYFSFHAFGGESIKYAPEFIQLSSNTTPSLGAFEASRKYLLEKYNYVERFSEISVGKLPSSDNYMERVLGIPSGTAEMIVYRNDGKERSAYAVSQHVEYYGDLIYQTAYLNIKPKKKMSVFKASERSVFPAGESTKIKFEMIDTKENYFEASDNKESIIIPDYINYIKVNSLVYVFNENAQKSFPLGVYVYVNGGLAYGTPTFYEDVVNIGYDGVNTRKRSKSIQLSSPPIYIKEGENTVVEIVIYNGNADNLQLSIDLKNTWLSIEEYNRYH